MGVHLYPASIAELIVNERVVDGQSVNLRLAAGLTVTCHWFNVPEDLAGDTGAVTVYKYACPVTVPAAEFDWYGRCDPQGQGVQFSLSVWDGSQFLPVVTGATDGDGILRFTRLQPGTYDLEEVDATWTGFRIELVEFRDLGDGVMALGHTWGGGRDGIAVDAPGGWVLEMRDGRISGFRSFNSWQETLEAAGLER